MIVGVIAVKVMQPAIMDEIDMGSVLHGQVFFARVAVGMRIGGDMCHQLFRPGIGRTHFQHMLVNMAIMRVVEVAFMQEVDMARMFERLMAADLSMGMAIMPGVKHLVRKSRCRQQRKRQCGAKQGSMHDCILQKRRSQSRLTPV